MRPLAEGDDLTIERLLDLMAMHTAPALIADDFANEFRFFILARYEFRSLLPMQAQDRLHGVAEPFERLAIVGVFAIASPIAGVDLFVGRQEEDHEGQIVIELEEIQVGLIDAAQTHADELVGFGLYVLETDNLPVEFAAIPSRNAAKHDHDRHARLSRELASLLVIGQPAKLLTGLDRSAGRQILTRLARIEPHCEANSDHSSQYSQKKPTTAGELKVRHVKSPRSCRITKE